MKVIELPLSGLKQITLKVFGDHRGFFTERYNVNEYERLGLPTKFVQDNHSRSAPGILRGLHFQYQPAQGKLVSVARGRIFDVAVDIRKSSTTFGQWYGTELSDVNGQMLWIPPGFAHGFCVLGDEPADVLYKVDELYVPAGEGGILWNDPQLGIQWPMTNPVLSARDQSLATFASYAQNPAFK